MKDQSLSQWLDFQVTNSGLIVDGEGVYVILISVNDFHVWWRHFESCFKSPIGRKLIYAASDDEEYFLATSQSFRFPKWFGKKKVIEAMNVRWKTMGWGVHLPQFRRIQSPCHDALSAGFGLAHHEHAEKRRYRLEWRQINSELIELDFSDKSEDIPIAPKPNPPEWVSSADGGEIFLKPLEHEFEPRTFGFFMGQERSMFIPPTALYRLFQSVKGRPFNSEQRWREGCTLTGLSEESASLFRALVTSATAMFEASEYSIFIQNQSDWESHLKHRIFSRGLGSTIIEQFSLEDAPAVRMKIFSPLPTLAVGLILGMWERAHGFPCDYEVQIGSDSVVIFFHPRKVEYI
ncbi:MAG TPA: hypothetical protein QGI72_01755 [Poseidonia sp.]|nr:hypothetical protein [Poseidonia sp.]